MKRLAVLAAVLGLCAAAPAHAQERLADPAKEARAHQLFRQIRCVVCQNESIDDSEAELAGTLRAIVRRQIVQGRSDAEIRRYLVDRYGEFVLLKPRMTAGNAILWLAPFALAGGGLVALGLRPRRGQLEPSLSQDEAARLAALAGPNVTVPPQSRPTPDAGQV